jgi:histone H3/H4
MSAQESPVSVDSTVAADAVTAPASRNREAKYGLALSMARTEQLLRQNILNHGGHDRVSEAAIVKLTGINQKLVITILEKAKQRCQEEGKKQITDAHIAQVIMHDNVLFARFGKGAIFKDATAPKTLYVKGSKSAAAADSSSEEQPAAAKKKRSSKSASSEKKAPTKKPAAAEKKKRGEKKADGLKKDAVVEKKKSTTKKTAASEKKSTKKGKKADE